MNQTPTKIKPLQYEELRRGKRLLFHQKMGPGPIFMAHFYIQYEQDLFDESSLYVNYQYVFFLLHPL
jgi:hypothetical protein